MRTDPLEMIKQCCSVIGPVLETHGFELTLLDQGQGSGGHFARAEFRNGDRWLELHFRYSLGLVTYHFGAESVSHGSLIRAILGNAGGNEYPGFSDDPHNSFLGLKHDLDNHASVFLNGDWQAFKKYSERARIFEKLPGLAKIP